MIIEEDAPADSVTPFDPEEYTDRVCIAARPETMADSQAPLPTAEDIAAESGS